VIVIDASVLTSALTDDGPFGRDCRARLAGDVHWSAPDHIVVEVFSAIRGLDRAAKITRRRSGDALAALSSAVIERVDIVPLLNRMWQLRSNLSGYDAAYVAVAEMLACPLVTADRRLGDATGIRCEIRLIEH
jgi:predicted nucleic acid-binding protein